MQKLKIILIFLMFGNWAFADFETEEPLIYPSGMGTAETLRDSEWHVAPPPWGWIAYGAHPRFMVALDYPAALFGIPAALLRFKFFNGQDTKFALEGYGAYWSYDYKDKRQKEYLVEHKYGTEWLRLNWSQKVSENWRFHLYGGANFSDYEKYAPNEKDVFNPIIYENSWSPTYGLDIEWKLAAWVYLHVAYSYGNTFYNVDQVSRKHLAAYTFAMAPFSNTWWGFFSKMRIELTALYAKVEPSNSEYKLPIPLLPYVYWQF